MDRLSLNMLESSAAYLKKVQSYNLSSKSDFLNIQFSSDIYIGKIFEFLLGCKLIDYIHGKYFITNIGFEFLKSYSLNRKLGYRLIIKQYILLERPAWAYRIPFGRREAFLFMNKDEQFCFSEASLMDDPPSEETIKWFDEITSVIRKTANEEKNNTGRIGEKKTIIFEKNRTKIDPEWISIDSNLVGYDIESVRSTTDLSPIYIEVKTTLDNFEKSVFHVTSNEWNSALGRNDYFFYLWVINRLQPRLAIITPMMLQQYIPINQEYGVWESAAIPYNIFTKYFIEVGGPL